MTFIELLKQVANLAVELLKQIANMPVERVTWTFEIVLPEDVRACTVHTFGFITTTIVSDDNSSR